MVVGFDTLPSVTYAALAVEPVLTNIVEAAGDGLVGLIGKPTNVPPTVQVRDQVGSPMPGIAVAFAVTGGGGAISADTAVSDANGLASVVWTLGASAAPNSVEALVDGVAPVTFAAESRQAAFDIEVRFFGSQYPTADQEAAFAAAEARWEQIIYGDLEGWQVTLSPGDCGSITADMPAISEGVDDLLIMAKVDWIDGPYGILGAAGPCVIRDGGADDGLPVMGVMVFDKADLAMMSSDQLSMLMLHEMGHVLGFGGLWDEEPFDVLANACAYATNCTTDPHFIGEHAREAFDRVGGVAYVAGEKVPVEDCLNMGASCGAGTLNVHWRERVLQRELMTGYLNIPGSNPLSIVSLGSLWDMHYLVDYSSADPYGWPAGPPPLTTQPGSFIELGNDVLTGPFRFVDRSGRVVRVTSLR